MSVLQVHINGEIGSTPVVVCSKWIRGSVWIWQGQVIH